MHPWYRAGPHRPLHLVSGSSGRTTTRSTFSLLLFTPALLPPQQKPLRRPLSLSHCPPGAFRLAKDPPAFRKSLQASATEPELPKQQETRTRLLLLSAPGLKFNNPCSSINTAPGAQLCRASHREPRGRGCSELGAGGGPALLPSWQAASSLACCSSGHDPQGLVPCSALSCLAQQLQEPVMGPGAPVLPLCDPHAPARTGCARHWHREQRHMGDTRRGTGDARETGKSWGRNPPRQNQPDLSRSCSQNRKQVGKGH